MGVSLHEDPRVTVRTKRQIRSARKLRARGQADARRSPARPAAVFVYGNLARCGDTHDPLWNAAQLQMVRSGRKARPAVAATTGLWHGPLDVLCEHCA